MTIGERVKLRRQQLGLTQQELAKRLGNSSRASICTIEKDREDLTTTRISKLAVALDTTESFLMGWTDNPNSSDVSSPHNTQKVKIVSKALTKYASDTDNDADKDTYYINKETAEVAQSLFDNEDMRLLFDAAKDSKPEDLKMAADLLKRLKATNPEG